MLKIHNSLGRTKQDFVPLRAGEVRMYVCGMTVYDYCHLGHARVLVVFDLVRRFSIGYDVQLHKRTVERGMVSLIGPSSDDVVRGGEGDDVINERGFGDDRLLSDPQPVPAVRELRANGTLDHTVATRLADVPDLTAHRPVVDVAVEVPEVDRRGSARDRERGEPKPPDVGWFHGSSCEWLPPRRAGAAGRMKRRFYKPQNTS